MRRITITLDVALETQDDIALNTLGEALTDELRMFLPRLVVPFEGVPPLDWPSARLRAVRVSRASEQDATC